MRDRRSLVVVMDGRGRALRRLRLRHRTIGLFGFGLLTLLLAGALMAAHSVTQRDVVAQARALAQQNQQLQQLVSGLEQQLSEHRLLAQRAEYAFAQLWKKSDLGSEPRMLGVGPAEDTAEPGRSLQSTVSGRVLDLEPVAVVLELERIKKDGQTLRRSLGDLLEYFHDAERLLSNTPSVNPSRMAWHTSSYGRRRDPITREWLMHKGVDLAGQTGDPVSAPADGVIIFAGRRGGYGLTVVIDHGYGLQTHFAHLNRFRVSIGDKVRRGQPIAEMGTTGKSTGPHLHYEVRRMGKPLDPERFMLDGWRSAAHPNGGAG